MKKIYILEPLHSFAWEPNGLPSYGVPKMKKFAIVSGEGAGKMNAVFYRIVLGTNLTAAKIEPISKRIFAWNNSKKRES